MYSLSVVPPLPPAAIKFPNVGEKSELCSHSPELARLEPADGSFIWGFDLQWDRDLPSALVQRLGKNPTYFNSFINLNATDFQQEIIIWNAQQCEKVGAMLELSIIPTIPIETIPDVLYTQFALTMRHINSMYGVPVLLRYMHEMNGNWFPVYGMRPIEFKQAFIKMSNAVRSMTNMTGNLIQLFKY